MTAPTAIRSEYERLNGSGSGALADLRAAAYARFQTLGFPTLRDEQWKYTSVRAIAKTEYALAPKPSRPLSSVDVERFAIAENEHRVVFVNGRFTPERSSLHNLPRGVQVLSLAEAVRDEHPTIAQHLAKHAAYEVAPFVALNTAFLSDGAVVFIPKGARVEQPIHLLFVTSPSERPTVTYPRVLIVAESQSKATIIESYVALDDGTYLTDAVTELVAGDGAIVDHCRVGREAPGASHIGRFNLSQGRDTDVRSHIITLDGALVRNEIVASLEGENGNCDLFGLYTADATRHVDNHMRVDHLQPHCNSREYFKGILSGRSTGVFRGRIYVAPGAQKTDAKQTSQSLLLSPHASARSKPQLEIFADDVKCTHGATTGHIEGSAMFYLRARGISAKQARNLLIFAFANEALSEIRDAGVQKRVESLLWAQLPHGDLPQEL